MARDAESIARAAQFADSAALRTETFNIAPAYKEGLQPLWQDTSQVLIKAGLANVNGSIVKIPSDYQLSGEDWVVTRKASTHHYIYLSRTGQFFVDLVRATYSDANYDFYHPENTDWRRMGVLFCDANGDVVYTSDGEVQRQEVVVAPSGYRQEADYIADFLGDQVEINAAIVYLSEAYGGGVVSLPGGTYSCSAQITLRSSIIIRGSGEGTVLQWDGSHPLVVGTGALGAELVSVGLINFKVTCTSATGTGEGISWTYVDKSFIRNVVVKDVPSDGIKLLRVDQSIVEDCILVDCLRDEANDAQSGYLFAQICQDTQLLKCICYAERDIPGDWIALYAIRLRQSLDCVIDGCTVRDFDIIGPGTLTRFYPISLFLNTRVAVTNNRIYSIDHYQNRGQISAIFTASESDTLIHGNIMRDLRGAVDTDDNRYYALEVQTKGSETMFISHNLLINCNFGIEKTAGDLFRTYILNNVVRDCGELIDRGECESTTPPNLTGSTADTVTVSNATFTRSAVQAWKSTNSYRVTITTGGTEGYVALSNTEATTTLHGLTPGVTYKFLGVVYVPSGALSLNEVSAQIRQYVYGAWATVASSVNPPSFDEWRFLTVEGTLSPAATAATIRLHIASTASSGEFFYVDHLSLSPVGDVNDNELQFRDFRKLAVVK